MDDVVYDDETTGDGPEALIKRLRAERDTARHEREEYLSGWQRAKADYVNLSKRLLSSESMAREAGIREACEAFLPLFDSLFAAGESVPPALLKQLKESIIRLGGEFIEPAPGDPFDPALHESVETVAAREEKEDNTIARVFQSGLKTHVVIRPARVSVRYYQP